MNIIFIIFYIIGMLANFFAGVVLIASFAVESHDAYTLLIGIANIVISFYMAYNTRKIL